MRLPQIRQDRANHLIYGFMIYILSNIFFIDLLSLGIVVVVALGKELYDEWDYGGFSIIDLLYTLVPAIILIIT